MGTGRILLFIPAIALVAILVGFGIGRAEPSPGPGPVPSDVTSGHSPEDDPAREAGLYLSPSERDVFLAKRALEELVARGASQDRIDAAREELARSEAILAGVRASRERWVAAGGADRLKQARDAYIADRAAREPRVPIVNERSDWTPGLGYESLPPYPGFTQFRPYWQGEHGGSRFWVIAGAKTGRPAIASAIKIDQRVLQAGGATSSPLPTYFRMAPERHGPLRIASAEGTVLTLVADDG